MTPKWTAIVIEDERDSMELVQGVLDHHGVESIGCETAEDALDALRDFTPNMLIVDLALPGMDGFQFLQELQADNGLNTIPRVAVTAFHTPTLAEEAIEAGFDAYFAKPIDATTFVRELEGILYN